MGRLIEGDDGLPAEEVGSWAKEKHDYLCRYIDISRATRAKYIGDRKGLHVVSCGKQHCHWGIAGANGLAGRCLSLDMRR